MFEALKNLLSGNGVRDIETGTLQGRKPAQEDSFLVTELRHGMRLIFVADGVGGHGHGDWASNAVVEVFRHAFDSIGVDPDIPSFLRDTAYAAAKVVLDKCVEQPEYKNCGTTVSGFLIRGNEYHTINIGDSRVYLWRESMLCRETHDQSVVQQLLDSGQITEDEAFTHPQRNMMTSAVGQPLNMMKVDVQGPRQLSDGDILMAFSDGVHDAMMDNQILILMQRYHGTSGLAQRIVQAAYDAGGKDNITAVIYRHSM